MLHEQRTRDYVARTRAEGRINVEILRCLKRAVAREVYTVLTEPVDLPRIDDLRPPSQPRPRRDLPTMARNTNDDAPTGLTANRSVITRCPEGDLNPHAR